MKVRLSGEYQSCYVRLTQRDGEMVSLVETAINRFRNNPKDTRLEVHALGKRMKGKHAFSVTDDVRIVFEYLGKKTVRFLAIGTHEEVYGRSGE